MNEYELKLKKEEAQLSLLECKIIESEEKIVEFKEYVEWMKPLKFVKSGSIYKLRWKGKDYIWTGKSDVNTKEIEDYIRNQKSFDIFVEEGCITLASDVKPKITIDCDLDKLAISIKGAIDTGNIRITDEKPTVIERLETIVKEFNYSVTLEANGDIAIYRKKPAPPQPIIIKSGDTWVAEFMGVDYLCINPEKYKHTDFSIAMEISLIKDHVYWKPISEIEITDEIAKLRPMIINASLKRPLILYAVSNVGMFICGKGVEKHLLNIATVKDLQE